MATSWVHRRDLLRLFGAGSAALVLGRINPAGAQVSSQAADPLPAFTGRAAIVRIRRGPVRVAGPSPYKALSGSASPL